MSVTAAFPRLRGFPLLTVLLSATLAGCGPSPTADPESGTLASATFQIEGLAVALDHGRAAWPAAPGSASVVETRLVGSPTTGDLDGDGDPDAVVWLLQAPGGSGTFYYLAPAIRDAGGYHGGTAVLIGDRIAPGDLTIRNGVVFADYADRAPGEAMADPPRLPRTRHLIWDADALTTVEAPEADESLLQGWLVIGHEVREFRPCGSDADDALWLLGTSPALDALQRDYASAAADAAPYTPVFVSLIGRSASAPATGFGAAYEGGLEVRRVVNTWAGGQCPAPRQG